MSITVKNIAERHCMDGMMKDATRCKDMYVNVASIECSSVDSILKEKETQFKERRNILKLMCISYHQLKTFFSFSFQRTV